MVTYLGSEEIFNSIKLFSLLKSPILKVSYYPIVIQKVSLFRYYSLMYRKRSLDLQAADKRNKKNWKKVIANLIFGCELSLYK